MYKKFISAVCLVLLSSFLGNGIQAQGLDFPDTEAPKLPEHMPGEILIRFQPWLNSKQTSLQMEKFDLISVREIPPLGVHLVKLPPGQTVEQAVTHYSHQPGVVYAEPNYLLQIAAAPQAEITDQWGLEKIQVEDAWEAIPELERYEILLATVDTGIDSDHSDLNANIWRNSGEIPDNNMDDDNNGYVDDTWGWDFVNSDNDPLDDNMHGTAVSSVMAGVQYNGGVVGVCPWCKVMAVKVMNANGTGTLDTVANGIIYAVDNNARVINLSLTGALGSQTLDNAVNYAWNEGALVVAAAGNDGLNTIMYPAAYANAMGVGSTNSSDYHSCFSNYAEDYISVVAPGESILVAVPNQGYGTYSGTSLSAPHVAGVGGLLFSQIPDRTNSDVRMLIETSSKDLGPPGVDEIFGYGRINAYWAVTTPPTQSPPPDGLFSTSNTASGYAHARKIVRISSESSDMLHLIWHTKEGALYRIRYATSSDNGVNWEFQEDVFSSEWESYHPTLATDGQYLYIAVPSRIGPGDSPYHILFTRKSLTENYWSDPLSLMGGSFHAVRPDIFVDPSNGKIHVVASSFDDAPYVYYRSSETQGTSWGDVISVNPTTPTTSSNTRYATVHANGANIYIASRTVNPSLLTTYYLHTVRSTDGGQTWIDQTKISSYLAFFTGEYGVSLAGVGDRLYMGYEVGGNLYFRRYDNESWSDYLQLESSGEKWPSITQAQDGQAWLLFEGEGGIYMRHYDGSNWESKESVGFGSYPNLKLGTQGDQVEWIYTNCNGAPFIVGYDGRPVSSGPNPTATPTPSATPTTTPTPTATNTPTQTPTDTPTPTETPTPTSTNTPTATPTETPTPTPTDTPTPTFTLIPTRPAQVLDQLATDELAISGTVSGSYIDTHSDDDQTQMITEVHSGGKPINRISYMEHKWSFEVHPGQTMTFFANAWGTTSSDDESFRFAFSLDDKEYTNLFTVTDNIDTGNYQSYTLPNSTVGRIYIRMVDTDRTIGNRQLDSVYLDHLFVRSETAAGYLPASPNNLEAIPVSGDQILLNWTDNASDAVGFQIERTLDGILWQSIGIVPSNETSFSDMGLLPNTTYSYRVRAYNETGYSGYSGTASATTDQASKLHVGDIDGTTSLAKRSRWNAEVTVFVHSQSEIVFQGATVFGTWSNGNSGNCTTDASGSCQVRLSNIKSNIASVTFTVTDLIAPGWEYHSVDNHDPDTDSDGTTIALNKP
jgi:thermitase